MKVISDAADKGLIYDLDSVYFLHLDHNWSYTIYDLILILRQPQIRDLTCIKQVVDVLNKGLGYKLRVSHQEADLLAFDTALKH